MQIQLIGSKTDKYKVVGVRFVTDVKLEKTNGDWKNIIVEMTKNQIYKFGHDLIGIASQRP